MIRLFRRFWIVFILIYILGINHQGTAGTLKKQESSTIDWEFFHTYAGYSTLLLAGGAAISSSNRSIHYGLAYSAAGMAFVTLYSGFYEYCNRFDLDDGITSEDNLHIILGTVGTLACITAVIIADSGKNVSHGRIGAAGGVTMTFSVVVITW